MPIHDTGAWLDDDNGEVVYEPPRRGTQLVAKGGEVSSAVKTRIAALGLEVNGVNTGEDQPAEDAEPEAADGGDTDDTADEDDKTVTTSGTKTRSRRK